MIRYEETAIFIHDLDMKIQGLAVFGFPLFTKEEVEVNTPSPEMLHRAALKGNPDLLNDALEAGTPVDVTDSEGTTALMLACRYRNYECTKILLEHGANPSAQKSSGFNTCLCYAAFCGALPIVELLIEYGADVEACGEDGTSAFLLACQCNHLEVAKAILAANPEYEKRIVKCHTPMFLAAHNGHVPIVHFLLSCGADIDMQRRVSPKPPERLPVSNGTTPLFLACQQGHQLLVRNMLEWGADANIIRDDGCSPLIMAVQKNHYDVIPHLLMKGANCGIMKNGETALHIAAYNNHLLVLRALIEHGADINLKDKNGVTALEVAQAHNKKMAIRYLKEEMDACTAAASNSNQDS